MSSIYSNCNSCTSKRFCTVRKFVCSTINCHFLCFIALSFDISGPLDCLRCSSFDNTCGALGLVSVRSLCLMYLGRKDNVVFCRTRAVCWECGHWVRTLVTPSSFTWHSHQSWSCHLATGEMFREIPLRGVMLAYRRRQLELFNWGNRCTSLSTHVNKLDTSIYCIL